MLLEAFEYIVVPESTNDFKADLEKLYVNNNKQYIYNHVQNVAATNIQIAEKFNLDKKICESSAYYHDIAAIIDPKDMLDYAKSHDVGLDISEEKYPFLLHQRLSAIIAREMFSINDERVLSAITHHTTLKANPSEYDMALFVADKLSWDQEGVPPFYELVKIELDKSLYHASLAYINFILKNDMVLCPHKWLTEAYGWLKEYCNWPIK